jgi:hypothetical protein
MTRWNEESVAAELLACEAERRDREPFTDECEVTIAGGEVPGKDAG